MAQIRPPIHSYQFCSGQSYICKSDRLFYVIFSLTSVLARDRNTHALQEHHKRALDGMALYVCAIDLKRQKRIIDHISMCHGALDVFASIRSWLSPPPPPSHARSDTKKAQKSSCFIRTRSSTCDARQASPINDNARTSSIVWT